MKIIRFLFLCIPFLLTSCIDDLPELIDNPFEDESTIFLEVLNYDYNPGIGRVEINYAVYYDYTQNKSIEGIVVIRNGINFLTITDPTQTKFVERNLPLNGRVCYQLAFLSENVGVRPTEEICIEL